jgi:hypothetical protein
MRGYWAFLMKNGVYTEGVQSSATLKSRYVRYSKPTPQKSFYFDNQSIPSAMILFLYDQK